MLSSAVNRARAARKNDKGFTLIELLIVIIILGVLAAIVVFSVRGITDRGKTSACKADIATVETAGEAYYARYGSYAADQAALVDGGFLHSPSAGVTYTLVAGPPASFTAVSSGAGSCAP